MRLSTILLCDYGRMMGGDGPFKNVDSRLIDTRLLQELGDPTACLHCAAVIDMTRTARATVRLIIMSESVIKHVTSSV